MKFYANNVLCFHLLIDVYDCVKFTVLDIGITGFVMLIDRESIYKKTSDFVNKNTR